MCPGWLTLAPTLACGSASSASSLAFVAAVYLVVVVGGSFLIGESNRPSVLLSVLATGIVAVAFEPLRRVPAPTVRLCPRTTGWLALCPASRTRWRRRR